MAASSGYPALAELKGRDFLSSTDITAEQTAALLQLAADLKAGRIQIDLAGRTLGLIFSKASTRTRVSFTVPMPGLAGQTIDVVHTADMHDPDAGGNQIGVEVDARCAVQEHRRWRTRLHDYRIHIGKVRLATDDGLGRIVVKIMHPDAIKRVGLILVVSGDNAACERAAELGVAAGGKAIPLAVAGAFHTNIMRPADEALAEVLAQIEIRSPEIPVVSNVDAQTHSDPEEIRQLLIRQVINPVRWEDSINLMLSEGCTDFYEVGPGKVLKGLLKRISRKTACTTINDSFDETGGM